MTARSGQGAAALFVLLGLAIFVTIVILSIAAAFSPPRPSARYVPYRSLPGRLAPPGPGMTPEVAPLEFASMTPDEARAYNAQVPLVPGRVLPARPFHYAGTPEDRDRATACLAAAVLYEAGDDAPGEVAVAQVVLNRLRHPAFPKTVCGVVFQGSERRTGCQFTFTCDGALTRTPNPAAWARARRIAADALSGKVAKMVGGATHYHADYVVPYWGSSLAKIAVVGPHIFYRWPGRWGLAGRNGGPDAPEPIDPRVAAIDGQPPLAAAPAGEFAPDMPEEPGPALQSLAVTGVPERSLKGNIVRLKDEQAGQFILQLDPKAFPGSYAIVGFTLCSGRPDCIVMGWTSAADVPRAFPVLPRALRTLAFLYRRSSIVDTAQPSWDCRRFPRPMAGQCLPGTGR